MVVQICMDKNEMSTEIHPQGGAIGIKLIVLGMLVGVSFVASLFVWGVVGERQARQEEASQEISELWSRPQTIAGMVLTIPHEQTLVTSNGEKIVETTTLTLLPKNLLYESEMKTEMRSRGIYETPVYTTMLKGAGSFDVSPIVSGLGPNAKLLWNEAVVSLNVSDTRGIASLFDVIFDGVKYQMEPSSEFTSLDGNGVHANIAIDTKQNEHTFSFELTLKGSRSVSFIPLGETTDVAVRSDWKAPSFIGEFLPENRTVTESGFDATWKIASYGRNLPQYWLGNSVVVNNEALSSKAFGVGLYNEVDFYTMVERSIKYSILFICLTFLTFFMYEVLSGLRIHPMQYLLVGSAIALFYLLLLSFSEVIGFAYAYLLSALLTTLLITGYCFKVLGARMRAYKIGALLALLYTYLYILLQLEQYALLSGSLLLFVVLAIVMYITRNLNWYSLKQGE